MKYHTLGSTSLANEASKSTLTIYTGPDFINKKMESSNESIIRCELEMAQRALKLQTRRCRQLVSEYSRKLQTQELQIISERQLREEQLSRVLRSLLVFESRLRQEQIFIRHQLGQKDEHIQRQRKELRKLLYAIQLCKSCSQLYTSNLDSCDSGSECCVGSQDTCESSSEQYTSLSECGVEDITSVNKVTYEKNKHNSLNPTRKSKKSNMHRRTTGTYFEVLKLQENDTENSRDESLSGSEIEQASERIQELFSEMPVPKDTFSERMDNLHGIKKGVDSPEGNNSRSPIIFADNEEQELKTSTLITDTIPVFEGATNDNWYASNSEPEDDEHRDIYRNNPVLECMNQILLKNINDSIHSPPKSPELNPKNKSLKKVKFIDEKGKENLTSPEGDYYETPIQVNNFYEVPQSIYSNGYEQIFNKCADSSWQTSSKINSPTSKSENLQEKKINRMASQKLTIARSFEETKNHYYVDMDTKCTSPDGTKRTKINRTPPALPPKPANLVSKFKIQNALRNGRSCENIDTFSIDSEPDYCSISELNLPTEKMILSKSSAQNLSESSSLPIYNLISMDGTPQSQALKTAEKNCLLQTAKQPQIKAESVVSNVSQISMLKNKKDPEIPKLPQVSEIIIPEEHDDKDDRITQDNYIKNNSQILKQISQNTNEKFRGPIIIGSSVSSLITGFNQHLLSEISNRESKTKSNGRVFSNFDKQSYDKQTSSDKTPPATFDTFDLSQNFEEFNLDECEIGEEFHSEPTNAEAEDAVDVDAPKMNVNSSVEIVRATNTNVIYPEKSARKHNSEASYEHFLECTGLSSKSIMTPSRVISNHKSMLKPKDIKLRHKARSSAMFEHSGNTVKYWSEPYL